MTIPIILDCDPGTDDAFAILLALASPELEVLAVLSLPESIGVARVGYIGQRPIARPGGRKAATPLMIAPGPSSVKVTSLPS